MLDFTLSTDYAFHVEKGNKHKGAELDMSL